MRGQITQKLAISFENGSACWKGVIMGHERKQAFLCNQQLGNSSDVFSRHAGTNKPYFE